MFAMQLVVLMHVVLSSRLTFPLTYITSTCNFKNPRQQPTPDSDFIYLYFFHPLSFLPVISEWVLQFGITIIPLKLFFLLLCHGEMSRETIG